MVPEHVETNSTQKWRSFEVSGHLSTRLTEIKAMNFRLSIMTPTMWERAQPTFGRSSSETDIQTNFGNDCIGSKWIGLDGTNHPCLCFGSTQPIFIFRNTG